MVKKYSGSSNPAKSLDKEVIDEEYWDAEEAEACDGITIKKRWPVPGSKGKTKLYPGKVTYLGEEERPYCFEVAYEDDEETMCLAEVMMLRKKSDEKKVKRSKSSSLELAGKTRWNHGSDNLEQLASHGSDALDTSNDGGHVGNNHAQDPEERIFDFLEHAAPKAPLSFGPGHQAGDTGDTFIVCFGSWVEALQKWSQGEKPHEVMSDSLTRVAKKSQWETLEWLVTLMAAYEADVNGSASSSIGQWNGTELMGRIRIKQSVADLSSHIVKTEHQVRCCILHGSLLSALMNGLITTISPPPFDLSANTLPSWVIAVAPDAIWPRDEVDFNDLQEDKEEEREGGKVEQKERGDRRERSAPQKSSKVKAK